MIGIISKIREEKQKNITIKEIGKLIISESQLLKDFIEFEKKYFKNFLQERSLFVTNNIIKFQDAPTFFKKDLIQHKKHINELLKQNENNKYDLNYFLFDIDGKTYIQKMNKLKNRILTYGQLLLCWDEIKIGYEELEKEKSFIFGQEL